MVVRLRGRGTRTYSVLAASLDNLGFVGVGISLTAFPTSRTLVRVKASDVAGGECLGVCGRTTRGGRRAGGTGSREALQPVSCRRRRTGSVSGLGCCGAAVLCPASLRKLSKIATTRVVSFEL
jgi:hypothetical protein